QVRRGLRARPGGDHLRVGRDGDRALRPVALRRRDGEGDRRADPRRARLPDGEGAPAGRRAAAVRPELRQRPAPVRPGGARRPRAERQRLAGSPLMRRMTATLALLLLAGVARAAAPEETVAGALELGGRWAALLRDSVAILDRRPDPATIQAAVGDA